MPPPPRSCRLIRLACAGLAAASWAAALTAGLWALHAHEATPGPSGAVPSRWPAASSVRPEPGRVNLVMAVHPRCPCTRASLAALGAILRDTPGRATARLLVFRPATEGPSWAGEAFGLAAEAVAGADVVDDPGGVEAARFGLRTSGAVAAFDASGRRRFAGGLTPGRGREGPSPGGRALLALIRGGEAGRDVAPAFGCAVACDEDGPIGGQGP